MLKKIIRHGIYIKKWMLWLAAGLLIMMTAAVAATTAANTVEQAPQVIVVVNSYGFGPPFLRSWIPVWFFALVGGIGASLIKIEEVDKHFHLVRFAKAFLGTTGAMALCSMLSTGAEPPQPILSAYAFGSAILAAILVQGFIFMASLPTNQVGFINAINPLKRWKIVPYDYDKKGAADDDA